MSQSKSSARNSRPNDRVAEIARYIEAHAEERLTLARLAARAGMSPSRLHKQFRNAFGVTPKVFQDGARVSRLKRELRGGENVTTAIYAAGYGSSSRVYGRAVDHIGMTPDTYRKGGEGESISHAYRETTLGPLMMAATDRGVCFVQFGDGEQPLLEQLRSEFPKATLTPTPDGGRDALDAWIDALELHLAGDRARPKIPLDLRGTAFQLAVWRFLLGVHEGDVISYGELARGIDRPKAVRAAASACAANRIAVLVPCHRVLRGDGGLGGYRWGVERKRTLLDAERGRAT